MKNKSFINSFLHAIDGIKNAFLTERNLRFHFVVANLICFFAFYYGLKREAWAVLMLTVFLVIFAELVNTAVEKAVDTATEEIKESAKIAKDAAAGAVLTLSVGAVAVGVCLFGDIEKITYTLTRIFTEPKALIVGAILAGFDLFILLKK